MCGREHHPSVLLSSTRSAPGRSTWQLLADRRFGPFIATKTLAFTGVWVHNIVAALLAWQLTSSATAVAAVSVVQFLPQILLAPIVGPLADRSSRGRLVAYGRIFCVAGSGGLAGWLWWAGLEDVGLASVLVATVVVGVGFAVSGPAMQAMVPDLVEPHEVGRAVGLDSLPTMLGRAIGPAIGGLLVAFVGFAAALLVATVGHALFGLVTLLIARGDASVHPTAPDGRFRDGLTYIRDHRLVVLLLLGVAAVGVGADPVVTLAPSLAHGVGGSDALVGYIGSAFGVGAVLGSATATILSGGPKQLWAPSAGLTVLAIGLAAAPLVADPWWFCGSFLVAGIGFTVALSGCTSLLHRAVPAGMRGRVMSLWLVAFMGTRPLAAILNGVLADLVGVTWAMVVMALVVALVAASCTPRSMRRLDHRSARS